MGYDGLADFKLKLAGSVSEGVPFIHRSVDVDDKTGDVLVKVVDNAVAAFLQYRNAASTVALERAAQAISGTWKKGKRIEFYGVGNSGIVAQDAQHKFFRLGVTSISSSDGHMQVMSATLLGPGDCAVIISNSGRTRDLMDAADIARKNGAVTIAITASGSPLASTCNIHLAADHPEGYDRYSPMVSRLMHLLIIDVLATCVALRIGSSLQPILQQMKKTCGPSATRKILAVRPGQCTPSQSSVTPASRITLPHLVVSAARKASQASGVVPSPKVPMASSFALVSSLWMMAFTAPDMRLTMSRGVPAGAIMLAQVLPTMPGMPCSMKVGTSGSIGRGAWPLATPISVARPARSRRLDEVGRWVEKQRHLPTEQIGERRRRATVGNVHHERLRERLEQLARQVRGRAGADEAKLTLPGLALA